MVTRTTQEPTQLSDRDRQILSHVFRYRMSTRHVVYRLFFEPHGLELAALTSVLRGIAAPYKPGLSDAECRKLAQPYYLRPEQLYGKVIYYHLTHRGTRFVTTSEKLPPHIVHKLDKPLNYEPRVKRYAALMFCCLGQRRRHGLTYHEFETRLAKYRVPGCPSHPYYFELGGAEPRLGFIRVDTGTQHARNYVNKCYNDVIKRLAHDAFRDRIRQGSFVVSLLTTTEERRRQLDKARDGLDDPMVAALIETEVVPELNNVLYSKQVRR